MREPRRPGKGVAVQRQPYAVARGAGISRGTGLAVQAGADGTSRGKQLEVMEPTESGLKSMVPCGMASGCCRHLQEAIQGVNSHITTRQDLLRTGGPEKHPTSW